MPALLDHEMQGCEQKTGCDMLRRLPSNVRVSLNTEEEQAWGGASFFSKNKSHSVFITPI